MAGDHATTRPERKLFNTKKQAEPDQPRPFLLQWWLWGSVTVVAAGVGGYFAWQTRSDIEELDYLNANSLAHPWSDAQTVESRAKRNLLVTNIAAGTAGVFAVGTIVLFLTLPDLERDTRTTTITPVPVQNGDALVLGGQF